MPACFISGERLRAEAEQILPKIWVLELAFPAWSRDGYFKHRRLCKDFCQKLTKTTLQLLAELMAASLPSYGEIREIPSGNPLNDKGIRNG